MSRLASLRWERVKEVELPYDIIKKEVKRMYGYEVKEGTLNEFIISIPSYININEGVLLSSIENNMYGKLMILSMKDLTKYPEHPIYEELTNPTFQLLFKQRNRINLDPGDIYIGELDSCYKVVNYKDDEGIFEITLASIKTCNYDDIDDMGMQSNEEIDVYDSVKFIINLKLKLVLMFYNDITVGNFDNNKEVTNRKSAFYNLFTNVSKSNVIKYDTSNYLLKYFNEYLEECEISNPKKLISTIETYSTLGPRSSVKSVSGNFKHRESRLRAIKEAITEEEHSISILECVVDSNIIKLKGNGEISLQGCTFQPEVMENVCKEFFEGSNLFKKSI